MLSGKKEKRKKKDSGMEIIDSFSLMKERKILLAEAWKLKKKKKSRKEKQERHRKGKGLHLKNAFSSPNIWPKYT